MNACKCIMNSGSLFAHLIIIFIIFQKPCLADEPHDWRGDWGIEEDFELSKDTVGYHFPTAIAFVPNPGNGPRDPLYFVTEIRGSVKVITNDRSVYKFADGITNFKPLRELPEQTGESGLAGICLDAAHGYVFVTFTYEDANGVLRNNIARFETECCIRMRKERAISSKSDTRKGPETPLVLSTFLMRSVL